MSAALKPPGGWTPAERTGHVTADRLQVLLHDSVGTPTCCATLPVLAILDRAVS